MWQPVFPTRGTARKVDGSCGLTSICCIVGIPESPARSVAIEMAAEGPAFRNSCLGTTMTIGTKATLETTMRLMVIRLAMLVFLAWPAPSLFGRVDSPAAAQTSRTTARLPKVHFDGAYFVREGKRFLPVGAHWVAAKAAMQWPVQWDPKDIEADFAKMHELGYNMTRLDMVWAWFEPRPGDYNPEAFRQLDFIISLAHKYQIYLHPSLFIGGEVGEAYWDVPYRHGRNPQSDPEMLRLETNHAAEFARRYANESAILAW